MVNFEIKDKTIISCIGKGKIFVGENITKIGSLAFKDQDEITQIVIAKSVTEIGFSCFEGCKSLKEIIFEEGSKLKKISDFAFRNCTSLKRITLPAKLCDLGEDVFAKCTNLEKIFVEELNKNYFSDNGVLYTRSGKMLILIAYPQNKTSPKYKVLKNTAIIQNNAFKNNSFIKEVALPHECLSVGSYAFYNCKSLTTVNAKSVKMIKEGAFYDCTSLSDIAIEDDGLFMLDSYAFKNCYQIKEILVPKLFAWGEDIFEGWKCNQTIVYLEKPSKDFISKNGGMNFHAKSYYSKK